MQQLDTIKSLIADGRIDEAVAMCEAEASRETDAGRLEMIYYTLGNAHRKREDWQRALNAYQRAIDINPAGPAATARKMIIEILNYYYKDQFNQ